MGREGWEWERWTFEALCFTFFSGSAWSRAWRPKAAAGSARWMGPKDKEVCVLLFSVLEPLGDCWQPTGFAWRDPICFDSDWTCDDVCDLRLIRFCILCTFKRMRLSVFSFPSLFINQVESGHDRGLPLQTEVRRNARLGSTRKGADRGLGSLDGAHVDGNWWLFVCC